MDDIKEYWIGENVDYSKLWDAYNSGKDGYAKRIPIHECIAGHNKIRLTAYS